MSPSEAEVYAALQAAAPRGLTTAELVDILYGDDLNGGPLGASENIKVYICRMRKQLPPNQEVVIQLGSRKYYLLPRGARPPVLCAADVLAPRQLEIYSVVRRTPGLTASQIVPMLDDADARLVSVIIWQINKKLVALGERICSPVPWGGYKIVKIEQFAKAA